MNSTMVTVEIEVEVFHDKDLNPASAHIHTAGVPLAAHGWVKAAALDVFEERVKRGVIR